MATLKTNVSSNMKFVLRNGSVTKCESVIADILDQYKEHDKKTQKKDPIYTIDKKYIAGETALELVRDKVSVYPNDYKFSLSMDRFPQSLCLILKSTVKNKPIVTLLFTEESVYLYESSKNKEDVYSSIYKHSEFEDIQSKLLSTIN